MTFSWECCRQCCLIKKKRLMTWELVVIRYLCLNQICPKNLQRTQNRPTNYFLKLQNGPLGLQFDTLTSRFHWETKVSLAEGRRERAVSLQFIKMATSILRNAQIRANARRFSSSYALNHFMSTSEASSFSSSSYQPLDLVRGSSVTRSTSVWCAVLYPFSDLNFDSF